MRKTTKMWFLGAMATLTALCGTVALQNEQQPVNADAGFTMEMLDGASVRLVGTDATTYGIKYTAKIAKESYNENAKYYVMIIPTGWLTKYNLSESYDATCDYYEVLTEAGKTASFDNPSQRTMNVMEATPKLDGDYYYFNGSITDVKYENSFRDFFGVAYMEVNGERTYAEFETSENVRSVSQVASAALNDKTNNWTTDEKASLKAMVQKAYNAKQDDDYTTVENVALPTISAESVSIALEKGKTYQLSAPTGIPENLGVGVEWSTNNDCVTVDENGLLTIAKTGDATVTATVLGEDYTVATVDCADNVLVSFDNENSVDNVIASKNNTYKVNGEECELSTTWHDTFAGRQGVVETLTTAQASGTWVTYVNVIFDKTKAEIMALDFDYISMWVWFANNAKYGVRSQNLKLYDDGSLPNNAWQEIRITKDQIESSTSYWVAAMGTAVSAIENFANAHGADRADRESWLSANNLIALRPGKHNCDSTKIYIDSISYGKNEDFNIALEEYTAPTLTGATFTLPPATMKNHESVVMKEEYNVVATCNGASVSVSDNQIELNDAGEYVISYQFTYNGIVYEKLISFTIKRAGLVLADFGAETSVSSLRNAQLSASTEANYSTHMETKKDSAGTERTGVVSLSLVASGQLFFNSLFTATEMAAVEWDYLSIWVLVERDSLGTGNSGSLFQWNGCNKSYKNKVWTEIRYTKDEINSTATVWGAKARQGEAATGVECFYKRHSSTGNGSYLFSVPNSVNDFTIYVDSIAFVKEA